MRTIGASKLSSGRLVSARSEITINLKGQGIINVLYWDCSNDCSLTHMQRTNAVTKYTAKPFVAGTPQAEVIGQTVLAFSQNLESDMVAPLLPKHGLGEINPEAWYPHQAWMNVLKELSETPGGSSALVAFGKSVVQTAMMPPEIDTIPKMLDMLHTIHHMNLRNIPADEGYTIEHVSDRHYIVYENTPNPEDAIYGFLWGLAARFKQPNELFSVHKIENSDPQAHPGKAFSIKWGTAADVA